jgi:KaiC/GvpD/RAD55 family RecA-like ATPase
MNENIRFIPPYINDGKTLYDSDIPENPMLWGHLLPKIGIATIVGSSDCGKSSLLRQLSYAVVCEDSEFLGLKLDPKYHRVIYVSSEDTDEDIKRIMKREHLERRNSQNYEKMIYIFDIEKIEEKISEILNSYPSDFVIVDSLNDFIKGDTSSAFHSRKFLDGIRNLAMKHKCLFILIHHYRKSAPDHNATKHDVLGSQSIEAKSRAVISMEKTINEDRARILRITKGNYVPDVLKDKVIKIIPDEKFIFNSIGEFIVPKEKNLGSTKKIDATTGGIITMFRSQGKSVRKIETILKEMGHEISKSTIDKFLKDQDGSVQCPKS